ncbi:MAG TPA: CvpA family protein [Phycisphaerae bacterium]|nr:CvpA family protein [Phycisphaerae bacterium]
MLFSLVVALMVILIAAFWAYQGFFSALIMFFESVVACMLAFGFYEVLAGMWIEQTGPGLGHALAFMGIFLGSLLLLRMATDKLIRDNVTLPLVLDRAGAAAAGFFTGMITVGGALTAIQMLPIGTGVFGFERYSTDKNGLTLSNGLGLFRPDEFVCGLAGMLSNDRFGGDVRFSEAKADYVKALYSARAVPMSEENMFVQEGKVKVNAWWQVPQIDKPTHTLEKATGNMIRNFASESPLKASNTFVVCNVSVAKDVSGPDGKGAVRFRVPQFRLVGPPPSDEAVRQITKPQVILASGMTDIYTHRKHGPKSVSGEQRKRLTAFSPVTDFILSDAETKVVEDGDSWKFDVAFEVPADFTPWYLEFKQGGRADLTRVKMSKEPPSYASGPQGQGGKQGLVEEQAPQTVGAAPGGALHVANAIEERTEATSLIPIPLDKNDSAVSTRLSGGKLAAEARFWVVPRTDLPSEERVTEFDVPEGKRMVQIGADVLKQSSMYSRAIGFANRVLAQIKIIDDKGNEYYAIGFYAAAEQNGTWTIEVQYDPNSEVPERALKKPTKVTHNIMNQAGKDKTKFGFLFIVEPGAKIVKFSAGAKETQTLNIEVP